MQIEICLDSLDSAQKPVPLPGLPSSLEVFLTDGCRALEVSEGSTNWRIELCSNLIEGGGLTPSIGLLRACKRLLPNVGFMVMIRPRQGTFRYLDTELETMIEDIRASKEEGVMGFVFGCLDGDGRVDIEATRRLVKEAEGHEITFHRAIDVTPDILQALDDIREVGGITRVLTSGGAQSVPKGLSELNALMERAATFPDSDTQRITIVPGSGINSDNLAEIRHALPRMTEFHLSSGGKFIMHTLRQPRDAKHPVHLGFLRGFGDGGVWRIHDVWLGRVFEVVRVWEERERNGLQWDDGKVGRAESPRDVAT